LSNWKNLSGTALSWQQARLAFGQDGAIEQVQRGERRRGAMAHVVARGAFDVANLSGSMG